MVDFFRRRPCKGDTNACWEKTNPLEKSRLLKPNLGVILIDMQHDFVSKIHPEDHKERIIRCQRNVLSECANKDIPVITLEYKSKGNTIRELNELLQNIPRHITFKKKYDNGFTNPDLEIQINEWGIKEGFFMGINASCCVRQTAAGAIQRGINIHTSSYVIGGQQHHPENLDKRWYLANGKFYE